MNESRTKKSIYNSIAGMVGYIFVMVSTMATRIVFARFLGEELLGLNSLFTSVLQILQISELGISTAMVVFLYEPIRDANKDRVKAIMALYKRVYNVFALILFAIGLLVQFLVIPNIVDVESVSMGSVEAYFFLFMLGIVCSYLFAYSKSIFYAEQKNALVSIVETMHKVIVCILQLIVIFLIQNYYLYLIIAIIGYLTDNLICHFWVLKRHPYLRDSNYTKLTREDTNEIIAVVKPIFVVRIADKVLSQTDSILINQFINIVTLGMYSNYHTIFNACIGMFNPVGSALTSSYGNLAITASPSTRYEAYKKSFSSLHLVAVIFCGLFICFIQDFIKIAYGSNYLLPESTAVLMVIYLYLYLVKTINYSYQNALGLQIIDQKQCIMQVFLNIILSVIFANIFGLNGIIMGTIISLLIFSYGYKGYIMYKKVFLIDTKVYICKTILNGVLTIAYLSIIYYLTKQWIITSFVDFFIKAVVMSIVSVGISFIILCWDSDLRKSLLDIKTKIIH